eukprot:ANDGO_00661.mRNA.1 D-alanine--D-alanine ligase
MSLRICVLSPSYEGSNSPFAEYDPPCDPSKWMRDCAEYSWGFAEIRKATAVQQIRDLVQSKKYDLFFNLCDGAWDEDRAGAEVVKALEMFEVPFTGADSKFYEPSKEIMKMVAVYEGVKTPRFQFAYTDEEIEEACECLTFPVICKHYNGYSSVGMTRDSKCATAAELRAEARRMIGLFSGVLIEEFISGREATVLVAENPDDPDSPVVFTPVECTFPEGETFKHFDLKWKEFEGMMWYAIKEPKLVADLEQAARRMFVALKGVSFGRLDLRICQRTGDAYFLEINPNCGVFYPFDAPSSADSILTIDSAGHKGFIHMLIRSALKRHQRIMQDKSLCTVRYSPRLGYGLVATRDIHPGEIVIRYEERPQVLVSKSHVEAHWKGKRREWFAQYCYPANEVLYFMWADRPEDWKPLNHSCDPNCWIAAPAEMDLVARKFIRKGEAITADYATFCNEIMADFECSCGVPVCRRMIRGTDYLSKAIRQQYSDHVSSYVYLHPPQ